MAHSAITIFQASMRKGTWADEDLEKHEKQIEQKRPSVAGVGVGALSVESAWMNEWTSTWMDGLLNSLADWLIHSFIDWLIVWLFA